MVNPMNILLATNFPEFNKRMMNKMPDHHYIGMPTDDESIIQFIENQKVDVIIYSILMYTKSREQILSRMKKMAPNANIIHLGPHITDEKRYELQTIGINNIVTGVMNFDLIEKMVSSSK